MPSPHICGTCTRSRGRHSCLCSGQAAQRGSLSLRDPKLAPFGTAAARHRDRRRQAGSEKLCSCGREATQLPSGTPLLCRGRNFTDRQDLSVFCPCPVLPRGVRPTEKLLRATKAAQQKAISPLLKRNPALCPVSDGNGFTARKLHLFLLLLPTASLDPRQGDGLPLRSLTVPVICVSAGGYVPRSSACGQTQPRCKLSLGAAHARDNFGSVLLLFFF